MPQAFPSPRFLGTSITFTNPVRSLYDIIINADVLYYECFMDDFTLLVKNHHAQMFKVHGATARGVDWGDEQELIFRYDKMLAVIQKDFYERHSYPSLLDVGCGWGGLLGRANQRNIHFNYTGIDIVADLIDYARGEFVESRFIHGDIFDMPEEDSYDFVVCNGLLTQKHSISIPAMEIYSKKLIRKMFDKCRHGLAFNMMSTRVNFMVNNLYYQNPSELLSWLLTEISPRVCLDHGYSSLASGRGKLYDYTVYIYKD